jgi:hypothetical protein
MSVMVPGVRTGLLSLNDVARRGRFVQGTRYVAAGTGRGQVGALAVGLPAIWARASANNRHPDDLPDWGVWTKPGQQR